MDQIKPGVIKEIMRTVESRHLAVAWGSGPAPVLATPALVAFCEECARLMVDPLLPAGQQTVGTWIDIRHMAPTPVGLVVQLQAELIQVAGRRLRFRIVARDDHEVIGEAEHERYVIDQERFSSRAKAKAVVAGKAGRDHQS